jgi:hypothetical protein
MYQRVEDDVVVVTSMAALTLPKEMMSPSKHQENKLDDTGGSHQLCQVTKGGTIVSIRISLTDQPYCHCRRRSTYSSDFFVRGPKARHISISDADN